jgi:serine/threonine protein kinase
MFLDEGNTGLTTTTAYTGTERYLAPELLEDEGGETPVPTSQSDIYALGCVGLKVCDSMIFDCTCFTCSNVIPSLYS